MWFGLPDSYQSKCSLSHPFPAFFRGIIIKKKTSGLLCPFTHRHGSQNPSMNLSPATSNPVDQWRIFSSRVPSLESLRIHQVLGLTYSAAVLRLHRLSLISLLQRTFLVKKPAPVKPKDMKCIKNVVWAGFYSLWRKLQSKCNDKFLKLHTLQFF